VNNIELLDCTLRDGGYINDWNFGLEVARSLINSLCSANIDVVELGFLRDCEYDPDKMLFNNIEESKPLMPENPGNTKFTLMALHNKYTLDRLEDNDGTINGIRVTFHDYEIDTGLDYINRLREKGYNAFCNPINITGYSMDAFMRLLEKVNKLHPYAFSIVDTFGSMRVNDLLRYLYVCDNELEKDIVIGCHLHENMSLALSLAQTFIKEVSLNRSCIIDASLFGMGRIPGNLCIELIANYLNERNNNLYYHIENILEAIDSHIANIKLKNPWGYSPEYFLSAKYNLHRNYAEYYYSKGNITFMNIDKLLSRIENSKKANFDADYAEELYSEQFRSITDDAPKFIQLINGKKILLIAPGAKSITEKDKIMQFIDENGATVFGINFISDIYPNIDVFFGNDRRFAEYAQSLKHFKNNVVATTNVNTNDAIRVSYERAVNGIVKANNSVLMLLNLLYEAEINEVWLAGVDGYKVQGVNYLNKLFENRQNAQNITDANDDMLQKLKIISRKVMLHFVTDSIYQKYL